MKIKKITRRLLRAIPGGAHTYSRGADQFPYNAPEILSRGRGCYVYDNKNKKYLDYGMGLRSVNIGYANKNINMAAIKEINNGNNLTRPSLIELEAANSLIKLIDSVDMVKFTKNGSTAVTAAVKLARAYTGKKIILRCAQHPFFSYDDWFIGSTIVTKGVPNETRNLTKLFNYGDIQGIKKLIQKYKNNIACIVLEPSTTSCPKSKDFDEPCCKKFPCIRNFKKEDHFLKNLQSLCNENKIIFILDEMITGFRWHLGGAQKFYNVMPDISTFGKAMANGFSLAAVCGKREIMELGSIEKSKKERVFLLSTTHGAEMAALGAFVETVKFIKEKSVIEKNWNYGMQLVKNFNILSKEFKLENNIYLDGLACSPILVCKDSKFRDSLKFKTLFMQEMLKNRVLMPWISISYSHDNTALKKTLRALKKTFEVYNKALRNSVNKYINGHIIKPVFRKFN